MLSEEMVKVVEKQRLGFVATVSSDGAPNLSPKATFVVIDRSTIAFGEIRSPKTLDNLHTNPRLEVNFVDPIRRKGFRAKGQAAIVPRGSDSFQRHIGHFERWGALVERIANIVIITIAEARPLISPAYDDGASEAALKEQWTEILLSD